MLISEENTVNHFTNDNFILNQAFFLKYGQGNALSKRESLALKSESSILTKTNVSLKECCIVGLMLRLLLACWGGFEGGQGQSIFLLFFLLVFFYFLSLLLRLFLYTRAYLSNYLHSILFFTIVFS